MSATLPQNRIELSLAEVARITDGQLEGSGDVTIVGVSTDSRSDLRGALFLALSGERFDGHDFVVQARQQGAVALLVDREVETSLPRVRVRSTLAALGALGAFRRRTWGGKLVAVAGSAGKTTTRAAVSALLEAIEPGGVHYARGNFNNLIGVPLVLLSLSSRERLAVVELGTNRPGEVEALRRMSAPDLGILTLIGYEHTEGLGDLDGVEAEEGALFGDASVAVGNGDDPRVRRQLAKAQGRQISYGQGEGVDYCFRVLSMSASGSRLEVRRTVAGRLARTELQVGSLGEAGAYAACAALAAVETLLEREVSGETCTAAFASALASEAGRLCPVELAGSVLLLDDTYNANPESVESSLRTARQLADQRQVDLLLVLGEMRELGSLSAELHRRVGERAALQKPRLLLAVGGDARLLGEAAAAAGIACEFVNDSETAAERMLELLSGPAVVLVKASRGVRAEKVVQRLIAAKGRAA